tara:strand:+ start:68 stop:1084 length:1017 start_codon:yes stop_codon:yes gene_type:complete
MDGYNIAVVGATGAVGEAMIQILEERQFPVRELFLLASERSAGTRMQFRGKSVVVKDLSKFDFSNVQIGLFSAGGSVSAEYAPKAAESGCVVIDNTSYFRRDEEIPLVVPEVNAHAVANYVNRNIIANPNCSTIQMVVTLKPIHDAVGVSRINVCTYQAVSGSGKRGIEELASQTADLLNAKPLKTEVFTKQISFNAIPHIGEFHDNGFTLEEMKMVWETKKIFENDEIKVNPTCVRIPVFYGHSEAIHIETCSRISIQEVVRLLSESPGVQVIDEMVDGGYPTAVSDSAGKDGVFVGRIRKDLSLDTGLDLWVVSDNVRKGAALNSVQIAEVLTEYL